MSYNYNYSSRSSVRPNSKLLLGSKINWWTCITNQTISPEGVATWKISHFRKSVGNIDQMTIKIGSTTKMINYKVILTANIIQKLLGCNYPFLNVFQR